MKRITREPRTLYVEGFGTLTETEQKPPFPSAEDVRELLHFPPPVSVDPLRTLPPLSIKILGCLSHNESTSGVYKVEVMLNNTLKFAILKLYHLNREPETDILPAEESDTSVEFQNETNAYAQLIQYGLTAKRMVPSCYGIIDIPEWPSPQLTGKDISYHFNSDHGPPKAILLEYLADMKTVGLKNLSESVAEETLRILTCIHEAYVIHRDCVARNIMVDGDGRVMIIDFGHAEVYSQSTDSVTTIMQAEYKRVWGYFYQTYLPGLQQMVDGYIPTSYWALEVLLLQSSDEFIDDE